MPDAAYFRAWRAKHPEYRDRQNRLRNERRRRQGRGLRGPEYRKRKSRAIPPIEPFVHPLLERARAIVGPRRTSLTTLYDPLHDDLVAEAALALVEGRDPVQAVRSYRSTEHRWGRLTYPIFGEVGA